MTAYARAYGYCANCNARVHQDLRSPTDWRHSESGHVNCNPPTGWKPGTHAALPNHEEPMARVTDRHDYLEAWREAQRETEQLPSDIHASVFFGTVYTGLVIADQGAHLTPAEIALLPRNAA